MQFLNPNVFYMMLMPLLLLIVLILTNKENMQKYFSKEVLNKLAVGGNTIGKTTRNGLLFFTLICFIVTLSRPVINQKEQDLKQKLIPIVIALDVSKSMRATDIYPNRISLAKQKLKQIIELSPNSMIGVLLFAKDSFILSPVTEDFISLKFIVDNLDTDLDFVNGSNIFATLEATNHMLLDFKVKNLIILSDGGNDNSYEKEIQFAKDSKITIYSIGLATPTGAPIPQEEGYLTDIKGNIVTVKLNKSIKNLSLQSGGGYIGFSLDNTDIKAIINQINKQSDKEELNTQKVKVYTELFYYPLALGLFVLLISLSSIPKIKFRKVNIVLLLSFLSFYLIPTQSRASFFEFKNIKNANQYYENKEYKKASDEYRKISQTPQSYYNLGNSLYKDGKYKEAMDAYSKVVTNDKELESKKLYNIGNSYVNSKNLEKAKEFYEKALKLKQDKQTQENLDMVNKELEKQKKKDNKDKNKDKKDNKQDKKQNDKDNKDKKKSKKNKKKSKKDKDGNEKEKKNQEKNKTDKENTKQDLKNKDEKKSTKKDGKNQNQSKQENKKQDISDMEEKKWMKMLINQKTPILLRKVETNKDSKSDNSKPW